MQFNSEEPGTDVIPPREDRLPESFASVLEAILEFSDAAITGAVGGHDWDPIGLRGS